MTANERQMYNKVFTQYEGISKPGIDIRSLIDAVISSNHCNIDDTGKFVAIDFGGFSGVIPDTETVLKTNPNYDIVVNGTEGSIGQRGKTNNTKIYVDQTSDAMTRLKSYINTRKRYDVSIEKSDTDYVDKVIIIEAYTGYANQNNIEIQENNYTNTNTDTINTNTTVQSDASDKKLYIKINLGLDGKQSNNYSVENLVNEIKKMENVVNAQIIKYERVDNENYCTIKVDYSKEVDNENSINELANNIKNYVSQELSSKGLNPRIFVYQE